MGNYLEVTEGLLANKHKSDLEKGIAARMLTNNNHAESPFAMVRAFLHIYPNMLLRTVASMVGAMVNGTRPVHMVSCPYPTAMPKPKPLP
jgi:hypothetical protein